MQQKVNPNSIESLIGGIDPAGIADATTRGTVERLLNVVEELVSEVARLGSENQRLRDEINRLKGEQGKPAIKPNRKSSPGKDYSSEAERRQAKPHEKRSKHERIRIDREEIIVYPPEQLPADAEFKGYAEVLIQELKITTDNVLFRKERYYSPSEGKTYVAALPSGYEGSFGPGLKALVFSLYYGGNMTQGKLLDWLADLGISISADYLANLLIKNLGEFGQEQDAVYAAGLESSPWQHFDQTGARMGGVNSTTNVVCNPWYTIYWTTPKKDRLSVLASLQNRSDLQFMFTPLTLTLLETCQLPPKWQAALSDFPQAQALSATELDQLLNLHLPLLGPPLRTRIREAAAITFYQQQLDWPVVQTLVSDDAPQFKRLTESLALCWVHEGRHYKKLAPVVATHQRRLDEFLDDFWDYYRRLLDYREAPSPAAAQQLRAEFAILFGSVSGYQQLDERKRLTAAKASELLLVLEHPELPLHNNPAELAARTMVQRRNISYAIGRYHPQVGHQLFSLCP
jgi:Transposase IS66 family